jgi:hypothetical protein
MLLAKAERRMVQQGIEMAELHCVVGNERTASTNGWAGSTPVA